MENRELLKRISINPDVLVGKPFIRGTQCTVQDILKLLADGKSYEEIKAMHQDIAGEDITASLLYASELIRTSSGFIVAAEGFTMVSDRHNPSQGRHQRIS
jgi:uncharacterized protein (DUF433 family)